MIEKTKRDHFRSLMNMVYQELISWEALAFIFKDKTSSQESSKQVIEFLLEEIQVLYSRSKKDTGNTVHKADEEFVSQDIGHSQSNETDNKLIKFSEPEDTNLHLDENKMTSQNDQNFYGNGFDEMDNYENIENDREEHFQDNTTSKEHLPSKGNGDRDENFQMVQYEKDCHICGERFEKVDDYETHAQIHDVSQEEDKMSLESESKQYEFEKATDVKLSTKNSQCQYCSKRCQNSSSLKVHERIHTSEKPFQHCRFCPKSFRLKSDLRKHERIHTGEKPYGCKHCDKRFVQKIHLETHERIHTGEKPYKCMLCDKSFNQISNFKKHQKSQSHLDE